MSQHMQFAFRHPHTEYSTSSNIKPLQTMVDPIGTPASILALVIFTINATITLREAFQDINNYPKEVVDLLAELEDLQGVLNFLRNVGASREEDLLEFKNPLSRCANACKEFQTLLTECIGERIGKRGAVLGWTRLQLAKNDVLKLKDVLARAKSTIDLALGGITL